MKQTHNFLADRGERQRDYAAFADKIKDITEFLVDVLQLPPSAYRVAGEFRGKTVTWHEPCHLGRYLGVKEQPRKILKSMTGIKYVEMPEADRCCCMAGTFSVKYYDLSRKIADRKIDNIASTGADIVVTDCPGCEVQLIDGVMRHQAPQKGMPIMELLAPPLPKK